MSQFYYPSQNRYTDPHQQYVTPSGSIYQEKNLSRTSNDIIKMIGDNIVVYGLNCTPAFVGSTISISISPGLVIHDSTAIALTTSNTLTCTVTSGLADTNSGAHLAIFTDFKYFETADPEIQTPLKLSLYHVNAAGVVTPFSGSPAFSTTNNKILVSSFDFTLSGATVLTCEETKTVMTNQEANYLLVAGVNYHVRGVSKANINSFDFLNSQISDFFARFIFHDSSRS